MNKIINSIILYAVILLIIPVVSTLGPYYNAYALNRIDEIIKEEVTSRRKVFLGGQMLGFEVDLKGAMIVEIGSVDTEGGFVSLKNKFREGDIILEIEGQKVNDGNDITAILNGRLNKTEFMFLIEREGSEVTLKVSPLIDRISGQYRLGISVKSTIGGLGTITYVKRDGAFAALGHSASGEDNEDALGVVYGCKILGIDKGVRGRAGCVKGSIIHSEKLGVVSKNIQYGLYGNLTSSEGELYDVSTRDEVTLGNAMICSEISGKREYYDIEILKLNYQSEKSEKGMVIKVTDKRLLALTGGIVQGMSGSPIIQNGKIVGAVTHVLIADPSKGYAIYIDWMLKN